MQRDEIAEQVVALAGSVSSEKAEKMRELVSQARTAGAGSASSSPGGEERGCRSPASAASSEDLEERVEALERVHVTRTTEELDAEVVSVPSAGMWARVVEKVDALEREVGQLDANLQREIGERVNDWVPSADAMSVREEVPASANENTGEGAARRSADITDRRERTPTKARDASDSGSAPGESNPKLATGQSSVGAVPSPASPSPRPGLAAWLRAHATGACFTEDARRLREAADALDGARPSPLSVEEMAVLMHNAYWRNRASTGEPFDWTKDCTEDERFRWRDAARAALSALPAPTCALKGCRRDAIPKHAHCLQHEAELMLECGMLTNGLTASDVRAVLRQDAQSYDDEAIAKALNARLFQHRPPNPSPALAALVEAAERWAGQDGCDLIKLHHEGKLADSGYSDNVRRLVPLIVEARAALPKGGNDAT